MKNCARFTVLALALAGAVALLPACNKSNKTDTASTGATNTTAMGAMNDKCPLTGMAANKSVTSTYHGKTVAFCCGGCQSKFNAMTDAKKDEVLAKVTTK